MRMNMNNLLRLSFNVQKLTLLSRNTIIPIRLLRTSCHWKASHMKDHETQKYIPETYQGAAVRKKYSMVIKEIEESATLRHVLQVIKEYANHMEGPEAYTALKSLHSLDKSIRRKEIIVTTTKEFALVCDILKKHMKQLSIAEVIACLRFLCYFHVPSSSAIVRDILEIIRSSVDNLAFEQISYVNSSLQRCQKTPLVEALSIALPIVQQSLKPKTLDKNDVGSLMESLKLSHRDGSKKDLTSQLLTALNDLNESSIKSEHVAIIMSAIANVDGNLHTDLLKKCQKIFLDSIENVVPTDLLDTVRATTKGTRLRYESFYNENLLDTCAITTVSKDFGFLIAIRVLCAMNEIAHINNTLLDYIGAKCFEDQNIGRKLNCHSARILIIGMATADYKPVFWGALEDIILDDQLLKLPPTKLLKLGINLATIEYYWPKLLARIFNQSTLFIHDESMKDRLLTLYHVVKLFYPQYDGPWPTDETLAACRPKAKLPLTSSPLQSALESALGGSQYILTNLMTGQGYNIDHVVIMRKGGFPIAVNNPGETSPLFVEDLKPPENSQVILLSYVPKYGYARNTQRLTGQWSLKMRALTSELNYTTIPISQNVWENLSEPERVRYISQAIRLKCEELSAVLNT